MERKPGLRQRGFRRNRSIGWATSKASAGFRRGRSWPRSTESGTENAYRALFAFGKDAQADDFKPHNYQRELFAYTGTLDNDTVMGWWRSEGGDSTRTAEDVSREKDKEWRYLQTDGTEMNWALIRALMQSVAGAVLFPLQDVLGLGTEARMNTPSIASGNWRWRMREGGTPARLRELATGGPGDTSRSYIML